METVPVCIITPCYNESVTVIKFLQSLEAVIATLPEKFLVIVVNDCSTDNTLELLKQFNFSSKQITLKVLTLRFNVGHQAAIYQGLLFAEKLNSNRFIVMDSDGEDIPSAIPELLKYKDCDVVHVRRGKRQEGMMFRFSYRIYKIIFRLITNREMNFGNYCMISRRMLDCVVHKTFTHFAAFLSKQRGTVKYIVAERARRIDGKSKMNFKGLLSHAFNSFVEYGEDLLLVFLKSFVVIMLLFFLAIGNVIYQKFFAHTAILGWTSVVAIGLLNMAIISIGFFIIGILLLNINKQKNQNSKVAIYEEVFNSHEESRREILEHRPPLLFTD